MGLQLEGGRIISGSLRYVIGLDLRFEITVMASEKWQVKRVNGPGIFG